MKLMNPAGRSEFTVEKLRTSNKFVSVEDLKSHALEAFQDNLYTKMETLCYIELGHGLRGKQRWLVKDDDLEEMYKLCTGKSEIILWTLCRRANGSDASAGRVSEKPTNSSRHKRATKYETHVEHVSETKLKAQ